MHHSFRLHYHIQDGRGCDGRCVRLFEGKLSEELSNCEQKEHTRHITVAMSNSRVNKINGCPSVQVDKCPCGQDAQLWEKVLGGQSGERYLCFTKEDKV